MRWRRMSSPASSPGDRSRRQSVAARPRFSVPPARGGTDVVGSTDERYRHRRPSLGGDLGVHPHRHESKDIGQSSRCRRRMLARQDLAHQAADGAHPLRRPSRGHPVRSPGGSGIGRQSDDRRTSRRPSDRAPSGTSLDRCRHGAISWTALEESARLILQCGIEQFTNNLRRLRQSQPRVRLLRRVVSPLHQRRPLPSQPRT